MTDTFSDETQIIFKEYCDTETGEIKRGILQPEEYVIAQLNKRKKKKQSAQYLEKKQELKDAIRILSQSEPFFFVIYSNLSAILKKDYATYFRFIYLCSFLNSEYVLTYNKKNMTDTDLLNIFGLTRSTTIELRNKLYKYKLIYREKKVIKVNTNYCNFYEIQKPYSDYDKCCRVFCAGIAELYQHCNPREHKTIGMIISLLRYMHFNSNILCRNYDNSNTAQLQPLTMKEVCDLLGYCASNETRLKNKFLSLSIGDTPLLITSAQSDGDAFILNPYVFYKGSDVNSILDTIQLFVMQSNSQNE